MLLTFPNGAGDETISSDTINTLDSFRFGHPFGFTFNFIGQKLETSFIQPCKQIPIIGQVYIKNKQGKHILKL